MGLLDGKVAVITGAGSGMGKASVGVFGQVASSRCCFMVPGTRSGTSSSE